MRRILCILGLAGLLAGGPGCFVIDELDSGMEKMKEASPGARAKANAEAEQADRAASAPSARKKDGKRIDLTGWWKSARTPSSGPKDPTAAIEIVTCRIGGEKRFMSKVDCEVDGVRY